MTLPPPGEVEFIEIKMEYPFDLLSTLKFYSSGASRPSCRISLDGVVLRVREQAFSAEIGGKGGDIVSGHGMNLPKRSRLTVETEARFPGPVKTR